MSWYRIIRVLSITSLIFLSYGIYYDYTPSETISDLSNKLENISDNMRGGIDGISK